MLLGSSKLLGHQPETGVPVMLKRGPYGLYVQLVSVWGTVH
jgi:topoisomerase IA-like protein